MEADILIPAAVADTIHSGNASQIQARLVVEAANLPVTEDAERSLFERGVAVVPDFIASAGAAGGLGMIITGQVPLEPQAVLTELGRRLRGTTRGVLSLSRRDRVLPREVAIQLAERRLGESSRR